MPKYSVEEPPRYLVSFSPKRIAHRFTDVLILGSGLAGLRVALEVDTSRDVLIVTKEQAQQSNSQYAQGGIAAVWDPEDCFKYHMDDTLAAGQGLCDPEVVEMVVAEAPERVRELIGWGTLFDSQNGEILLTREGGHSFNRILHALGDATGKEVIRAVLSVVRNRQNIQIQEDTFTIDLLTYDGRCVGALCWSSGAGVQAIWARQTVLASGGCGQLYRETTNPSVATGDGIAMAYRAGATLQDMEFIQFHPTVLYAAGTSRSLISEAVRGEGSYLRDCRGERFMPSYTPQAELAPRDVVARAIVAQMAKTQHPCVYLDQSHLDADRIRARFPGITAACAKCGLDFAADLIPVRPGAHYMIGGVQTDAAGKTTLPDLWACGEVAATGLHGANRLASNSLLETLVFGQKVGLGVNQALANTPDSLAPRPVENRIDRDQSQELDLADIRNSLTSLMFRDVGIERSGESLLRAQDNVHFWCQYVLGREFSTPAGWELQNMLLVAGLMIRAALERRESRGTQYRTDFPDADENLRVHLAIQHSPFRIGRKPSEQLVPQSEPAAH